MNFTALTQAERERATAILGERDHATMQLFRAVGFNIYVEVTRLSDGRLNFWSIRN